MRSLIFFAIALLSFDIAQAKGSRPPGTVLKRQTAQKTAPTPSPSLFIAICDRPAAIKSVLEKAFQHDCHQITQEYLATQEPIDLSIANTDLQTLRPSDLAGLRLKTLRIDNNAALETLEKGSLQTSKDGSGTKFYIFQNPNLKVIKSGAIQNVKNVEYIFIGQNPSLEVIESDAIANVTFAIPDITNTAMNEIVIIGNPVLKVINSRAVHDITNIKKITIQDNPQLRVLGSRAFSDIRYVQTNGQRNELNVINNESLAFIGPAAFSNIQYVEDFRIISNASLENIEDVFDKIEFLKFNLAYQAYTPTYRTALDIRQNVSLLRIGTYAFRGINGPENLNISDNLKLQIIETSAFDQLHDVYRLQIFGNPKLSLVAPNFVTRSNRVIEMSFFNNPLLRSLNEDIAVHMIDLGGLTIDYAHLMNGSQFGHSHIIQLHVLNVPALPFRKGIFGKAGLVDVDALNLDESALTSIPAKAFTKEALGIVKPLNSLMLDRKTKLQSIAPGAFDTIVEFCSNDPRYHVEKCGEG